MKFFLIGFLLTQSLLADTFKSRVLRVSEDRVYWENGRVTRVDDKSLLEELENSLEDNLLINESPEGSLGVQTTSYEPTVLESEEGAQDFFHHARRVSTWQWSWQCYNIAHVRSYEEFKRSGLKSMKIFLFFSDRYIRDYNFKWWYHVTPMTYVKTNSGIEERVIDKEWMDGPVSMKTWTDTFMKNKAHCKRIEFYSEYENQKGNESCYLLPANMYYWLPRNLEEFERTRDERKDFSMWEVRRAYKEDM